MERIVEMPAILSKDGKEILHQFPEMISLSMVNLEALANALDGKIGWLKMRAVYSELETPLCATRNCTRPTKNTNRKCADHG